MLFINYTLKNCSELKQRNVSQEWKHGTHFSYTINNLKCFRYKTYWNYGFPQNYAPRFPFETLWNFVFCFLYPHAAAAKSFQSCPTLCDPIDGSPSGSPILGTFYLYYWVFLTFRVRKTSTFKELMFYLYLSQSVYTEIEYIYPPLLSLVCFFPPSNFTKRLCLELVFSKYMWNQTRNWR